MTQTQKDWAHWDHLAARYQGKRPRRMLALDGGGIRGLMTATVLVHLEKLLAEHYEKQAGIKPGSFRLCQFFDYVAGTSTGAIIAAAIARGLSAQQILEFYRDFGRTAFTKRQWYNRWKSLYGDGPLAAKLKEVYSEQATLEPQHLKTLLLVVTRNATTDSAWPITSNPDAKYNAATRPDCNHKIRLWQLVRASTAAPVYFPPEVIQWDPVDANKSFVFVDGGTTAYNNPAFCLARMAMEPAYKLNWDRGESNLLVVSLGTGLAPTLGNAADDPESNLAANAVNALSALSSQASFDQDINCRTVGRCTFGHPLDREVWDLVPREDPGNVNSNVIPLTKDLGRAFLYARYNAILAGQELAALGLPKVDPKAVSKLDSIDAMDQLEQIGTEVGKQIQLEHFGSFVNEPLS